MLINKSNLCHLLNSFAKHIHQAKTTLSNSISLQLEVKQESHFCFTIFDNFMTNKQQQFKLTASAAFLNHWNAVLLSCFTAVLPSEYICQQQFTSTIYLYPT